MHLECKPLLFAFTVYPSERVPVHPKKARDDLTSKVEIPDYLKITANPVNQHLHKPVLTHVTDLQG